MRTASVGQRAMALSLVFLLVSCSATRPSVAGPTGPRDLANYAILFETQPDGTVTHTWKLISEIDLTQYQEQLALTQVGGRVERTSTLTPQRISEICGDVYEECFDKCVARPLPNFARHYYANHPNTRNGKLAAKREFCGHDCAKERDACFARLRRQTQEVVEFTNAERAIEWVKRNKEKLAVGAVVVIAAVIFIAVVCGSGGCVLLIPVLLVDSNTPHTESYIAGARR